MTEVNFVWAADLDGWIGKDQGLPWRVSADLRHFKNVTLGQPVVMGRSTFDSIGRPLPNRTNVVLTHRPIADDRVITYSSVVELKEWLLGGNNDQVAVIGGAKIFAELLPLATVLTRTIINGHYHGDTKMPPINYDRWHRVSRRPIIENGRPVCWFEEWRLNKEEN